MTDKNKIINQPNLSLKLLLRLWYDQQRRDFKWGRFLGEAYFAGLFIVVASVITWAAYSETGRTPGMEKVVSFIAAGLILPDFVSKLLMKHDETVMDHYLKSRPISEVSWNRFLLFTNLFNFWNWAIPMCLLPFCLLFLPFPQMLPAFLLLVMTSMVGGVAITSFCKAKGWTNKWPVLVAIVIWFIIATVYSFTALLLPWGVHVTGFLLLCAGAITVFYNYLCELRRYDESQAKVRSLLFIGASSLLSMEYISVLRSKRLRVAVLVLPLVFVFNSYTQLVNGPNVLFYIMLMFAVFSPSMMLAQWVFGIEGNYFDGLWTKPVSISEILHNKFWFYACLDIITTLMVMPVIWIADVSPWVILATWLFTAGIGNLILMPTALISSRIELFQSAFFNYQGASMAINIYSLIIFVPIAIYAVCTSLLSPVVCALVLSGAGLAGFALHHVLIEWLARKYERSRYTCFERYRQ